MFWWDLLHFLCLICCSCFIVGEDDSGRRGSVTGRQCHHHAFRYTIMTMNTNACRNVHNYVTYIKYINRAIMICLFAQRLVNTDYKTQDSTDHSVNCCFCSFMHKQSSAWRLLVHETAVATIYWVVCWILGKLPSGWALFSRIIDTKLIIKHTIK